MSLQSDLDIIGGLSNTSKMPCYSWSIPATYCKLGSKLRKLPGTTCSNCYACKGMYVMPNVIEAMERRYAKLQDALADSTGAGHSFIVAFSDVLNARYASTLKRLSKNLPIGKDGRLFRWHDSGDLQNVDHLHLIASIAERTPMVQHWLPTREVGIVRDWLTAVKASGGSVPKNLTIRLSLPRVDSCPSNAHYKLAMHPQIAISGVHSKVQPNGIPCSAYERGGECGECRVCSNSNYVLVSYPLH